MTDAIELNIQVPIGIDARTSDTLRRIIRAMQSLGQSSEASAATAWKEPARASTTANITLSGIQAVDGVALKNGDRVLVKNQTAGLENGIYEARSTAWVRTTDADSSADIVPMMAVSVNEGTTNKDIVFLLTTNAPIVLGQTALVFSQISGVGGTMYDRRTNQSAAYVEWKLDDNGVSANALSGNCANTGTFGTLTLTRTGQCFGTPDTCSVLGHGCLRTTGAEASTYMSVTSSMTLGNTFSIKASVSLRKWGTTKSIIVQQSSTGLQVNLEFGVDNGGRPYLKIRVGGSLVTVAGPVSAVIHPGRDADVACHYDGSNVRIFIDGIEIHSAAQTGTMDYGSAGQYWSIFNSNSGSSTDVFNGYLDQVALWNSVKTDIDFRVMSQRARGRAEFGAT